MYAETTPTSSTPGRTCASHRIFKGDDWRGTAKGRALEERLGAVGVEVVYFPYTMHTSSTMLRRAVRARAAAPSLTVPAMA